MSVLSPDDQPSRDPTVHLAFLGLGSNIDPEINLPKAVAQLRQCVSVEIVSSAWETPPVGTTGPNYLNAAVQVTTALHPQDLKEHILCEIEAHMGRIRTQDKNAPRPIDLDILIYDGRLLDPALWEQAHLAVPVAELLPGYQHPDTGQTLQDIAQHFKKITGIQRKDDINLDA